MNWTGGRLQRSKSANKGIIQKQKAHFARARTRLQNDTPAPASISPCHSSFFRGEDSSLGGQLPPFSKRTIRHTGHSRTLKDHDKSIGASPVRHGRSESRNVAERSPLHATEDTAASGDTSSRFHHNKRAAADDPEEGLLEARRRELLQQSDWAGLKRPKAPVMRFKAQGRERIGKRHALTRRGEGPGLVPHPLQTQPSRQSGQDTGGAHQGHDVRIRFGTDALTDVIAMQNSHSQMAYTLRGTWSKSTPLDNENVHITLKPGQQADPDPRTFVGAHTHGTRQSTQEPSLQSQQRYHVGGSARMNSGQDEDLSTRLNDQSVPRSSECSSCADSVSPNEKGEAAEYCNTHRNEGIARPSRLTFDTACRPPPLTMMNNASPGNMIGQMNHDHRTANAILIESGNVHAEEKADSDEDGPWKAFLPAQSHSSSLSLAGDPFAVDCTHDRPIHATPWRNDESVQWSQQPTQGGRTLVTSSTCDSPSLPSIPRGSDNDRLLEQSREGTQKLDCRAKKPRDEDGLFWQQLVFESDKHASTDVIPETKAFPNQVNAMTEKRIPSSMAVSISSTPFGSLSCPGARVSDSARSALKRAPLATSSESMLPVIASSTALLGRRGQAEEASSRENSVDFTPQQDEHSGLGVQSVTHTSMQNNVSHGSDASSRKISGESARAPYMALGGCTNDCVRPARARRRAPVYDISVSSDDGLDLVGRD